MKKNSFIDGAIVATISIVVCKILGLIYVIPFYKIIGTQGGALYSYAYSIYAVFLNLSTVGIPTAVAKIVSEYDALGYHTLKNKAFHLASKLLNYAGVISFVILFLFADFIAESIIGGVEGGNTVGNVSIAIRIVSLALLVVPKLSILKGYFQGNKFIGQSSYSAIIEQFARVVVIIAGSYIVVYGFKLPVEYAVYVAIFGATVGALFSYFYLKIKSRKVFEEVKKNENIKKDEPKISSKDLIKKIVIYAIPFVIISLLQSAYNVVDTFTVVKTLTKLNYTTAVAETTIGVMSTWGSKLNMIVISMSIGLTSSLVPNIVGSYAVKDFKDINDKINLSIKMLVYITVPMVIGISFLSVPIWNVFYGYDILSSSIFRFHIWQVIFYGLFTMLINVTQSMNQTKITIGSLVVSFLIKLILNVPMMYLFNYIGLPSYYAPTVTDILAQFSVFIGVLFILKKKFNFKYKTTLKFVQRVLISALIMVISLFLLKVLFFNISSVLWSIVTITVFTILGAFIYFMVTHNQKLLSEIFGKNYIKAILKRLKLKKD